MSKRLWNSLLPDVVLLWLFFASREINNLILPAYNDEAATIEFSRYIPHGQAPFIFDFLLRREGKMLVPLTMRLFRLDGPESLWLLRAVMAVMVMLSFACAMALARQLFARPAGRLAGAMYIVSAMLFLNERMAWDDSIMVAFSALATILTVMMIRSRKARYIVPLSLVMLAATLSKLTGLLVLIVPLTGAFVLPTNKRARRRALAYAVLSVALVLAVMGVLYRLGGPLEPPTEVNQEQLFSVIIGSLVKDACNWSTLCEGTAGMLAQLLPNLANSRVYGLWMWVHVGPPMLALALASLAWLVHRDWRRGIAFLWLVMVGRTLLLVGVSKWVPFRNFLYLAVPMTALAALSLVGLWRWAWRTRQTAQSTLRTGYTASVVLVALGAIFWTAPLDLVFVQQPQNTYIPPFDLYGCDDRNHFNYAYGYPEVSQTLMEWMADHPQRTNVIAVRDRYIIPYWGPRLGEIIEPRWGELDSTQVAVALWTMAGESVFVVDEVPGQTLNGDIFAARLETVAQHEIPCGEHVYIRVRRVVEPSPEVRRAIYEVAFSNPNDVADQYRAIALHLIDSGAEGAVVVYPPNQLDLLANRLQWGTNLSGVYAVGDMWPLDPDQVEQSLEALAAEHGQLHVVLLDEARGDPDHVIETWLDTNMTFESEEAFGPVRLLNFRPAT